MQLSLFEIKRRVTAESAENGEERREFLNPQMPVLRGASVVVKIQLPGSCDVITTQRATGTTGFEPEARSAAGASASFFNEAIA